MMHRPLPSLMRSRGAFALRRSARPLPSLVRCVGNAAFAFAFALALALLALCSCTDPGLCYEPNHPHTSNVGISVNYEWPDGEKPAYIDSMSVLAVRIINHRKYGMVWSVDSLRGRYFFNAPPKVDAWVDPYIEPEPEPEPDSVQVIIIGDEDDHEVDSLKPDPHATEPPPVVDPEDMYAVQTDHFVLNDGVYKFFTMPSDTTEVCYSNINEYLEAPGDGMQASDINMYYRTYQRGDSLLVNTTGDWTDYNPAFPYIQSNSQPLYSDTLDLESVSMGQHKDIIFHPKRITQQIDLNWVIRKDISEIPFVIDSVKAEISGIPSRTGLFSGHLYLARTNKMLFDAEIVARDGGLMPDDEREDSVIVHARINVLSIVNNKGDDYQTGPGFLQVMAYCHAVDPKNGLTRHRTLSGIANLHRELNEAELIWYDPDGQYAVKNKDDAVIDIQHKFRIGGKSIISGLDSSTSGGIDVWVESDEGHDLEL